MHARRERNLPESHMKLRMPDSPPAWRSVRSRPLDVHRWSDYPQLNNNCISDIAIEVEAHEKRKRRRTSDEAKKFKDALRVLVLDLYVAWKTDPAMQIGVTLDANRFSDSGRYSKLFLTYRSFKAAYDGLKALGYLRVEKRGVRQKGWTTKIRATEKLIELLTQKAPIHPFQIVRSSEEETIRLKDRDKKLIEYVDTAETERMRANLKRINQVLLRHWADLELADNEFSKLQARLAGDLDREAIDFSSRTLYRVFNDGSFELGGRFYGAWWQNVPREYRRYITINSKPTVELDYSGLHPRILYGLAGYEPPADPYSVTAIDPKHRDLVKIALNAIINAEGGRIDKPDGYDDLAVGFEWREFLQRVEQAHQPIARFLRTGYGLRLQFLDSCIAERVMLHFAERNIPCLPIHDSFVMHHGYEMELEQVMQKAFRGVVGGDILIKAKLTSIQERAQRGGAASGVAEPSTVDVDELFTELEAYAGYNARIDRWFGRKHT
jgi:hypothetical protein